MYSSYDISFIDKMIEPCPKDTIIKLKNHPTIGMRSKMVKIINPSKKSQKACELAQSYFFEANKL